MSRGRRFSLGNDDCAYTEDGVRITNIFILSKKPLILPHELEEYCVQKYGRITKLRMRRCGFVVFADPRDAAKMLKSRNHQYRNKKFFVGPSYSWQQPAANDVKTPLDDEDGLLADDNATRTGILNLNDDCLMSIFDYLDIKDQIRMTQASTRFESVFKLKNQYEFKTFDLKRLKLLTLWQQRDLLRLIGDGVKRIVIYVGIRAKCEELLRNVATFCVNLRKIEFENVSLNLKTIDHFISNRKEIEEIYFGYRCTANDKIIGKLQNLPNLVILRISFNHYFTGEHLNKLTQLEGLHLQHCGKVRLDYILRAIKNMKNLRSLGIEADFVSRKFIQQIIQIAPGLESLHISANDRDKIDFGNLRCLKECSIKGIIFSNVVIKNLARTHYANLEVLRTSISMDDTQTAHEIIKFKNLKKLVLLDFLPLSDILSTMASTLANLEEIVLDCFFDLTEQNLIALLKGCPKLQRLRWQTVIDLPQDYIESMVIVLREEREKGLRSEKLTIFEGLLEDWDCKDSIKKYDSMELEVISERCDSPISSDSEYDYSCLNSNDIDFYDGYNST